MSPVLHGSARVIVATNQVLLATVNCFVLLRYVLALAMGMVHSALPGVLPLLEPHALGIVELAHTREAKSVLTVTSKSLQFVAQCDVVAAAPACVTPVHDCFLSQGCRQGPRRPCTKEGVTRLSEEKVSDLRETPYLRLAGYGGRL